MKNWIRKIGLILIMVLVTGLLTACSAGSTIETTLTINDDLSGTRVMELVIDQSSFTEYFTGTIEELNTAITESCPADLAWVYDDSTGVQIYTFTLEFTSLEDYKTKVDTIIGESSDVEIVVSKTESVWSTGVLVEESFSSGDILNWLKTLVVEKGFVSSSNSSYVFSVGDNTVLFGGEEYTTTYDDISIDEIEYVDINSIAMLTDVKAYDCYDKTIVISIPEYSMERKGEEIKPWLEARVPNGATGVWSTDGTDSVYTVSKEDMTAEQLETFLQEYFDTDACTVEQTDVRENMSPFSFNVELVETVDVANYVPASRMYYTDIYNYVLGENGYVGGEELDELCYYTDASEDTISNYEGYRYSRTKEMNDTVLTYASYAQKLYRVEEVNVSTNIGLLGGLSRTFNFILDAEPTDEEKAGILERINALGVAYDMQKAEEDVEDSTEVEPTTEIEPTTEGQSTTEGEPVVDANATPQWKVKVSEKMQEDGYTVTIEQTGTREEIKASSKALFGEEGDLYRVKDFSIFKIKYDVAVYDNFDFGDFVDYTVEDVEARYVLNTGFGSEMEFTNPEDDVDVDGNEVTIKDNVLYGVNVVAYGTQFNLWAVFFYLFIVVAIACVVIAVLKSGIINVNKTNVQPQVMSEQMIAPTVAETQQAAEQTEAVQPEAALQEEFRFCGNCGTKCAAGAAFCPECGTKF